MNSELMVAALTFIIPFALMLVIFLVSNIPEKIVSFGGRALVIFCLSVLIMYSVFEGFMLYNKTNPKQLYCGKVVDRNTYGTNSSHIHYVLVFYCEKEKKNIVVNNVNSDTYYNHLIGSQVCFELRKDEVR